MKTPIYLSTLALALLLSGCGSDSDSQPPAPEPKPENRHPHPGVFGPKPAHTMAGASVRLWFGPNPADYAGTKPDGQPQPLTISGDRVLRWLDQNHGGESLRNQQGKYFKPGNFSILDVAAYAVSERREEVCRQMAQPAECDPGLQLSWDEGRRAYGLTVDGRDNWTYAYWYYSGNNTSHLQDSFTDLEHADYLRAGELVARDKMLIGFYPSDDQGKLDNRREVQQAEVQRLADNGGKVIIPTINVQTRWRRDPKIDFETRYLTEEGEYVTESGDAALDDNGRPKTVMGYMVTGADGQPEFKNCGLQGQKCNDFTWDYTIHDLEVTPQNIRSDIFYDGVLTMADVVLSLNKRPGQSGSMIYWKTLNTGANAESFAFQSINGLYASGLHGWLFDWGDARFLHPYFGSPHVMPDIAPLGSPSLVKWRYADFYSSYYDAQKYIVGDEHDPYRNTRHHVLTPKAPLTEKHFGWRVADCGQCHSGSSVHNGEFVDDHGNTRIEPAMCAECHGSNGAPKGHDEQAGCLRCHYDMVGHGDAGRTNRFAHPWEKEGIGMSEQFPDPYACVSCHINDHQVPVGGLPAPKGH